MGLLDTLFGKSPFDVPYYDYQGMAAQRMADGYEPINWPLIIMNQFRAIALTRPLDIWEQYMYDGATQKVEAAKKA